MKDLYKILSGKIFLNVNGSAVSVEPFSIDDRYKAEIYAEEKYQECFDSGCYTEDEALELLKYNGWWTKEDEYDLDGIPKIIEQMKLDYFNNYYRTDSREYIKSNIKYQLDRFQSLISKKNHFYFYTCECSATYAKNAFLIENSSFVNNTKVDFNIIPLSNIINKYNEAIVSDEDIRAIARSNLYRTIWMSSKKAETIFPNKTLTDMQLSLITWSRVYDNVYESMDCPSDDVVSDDLALDGWFIMRRKKNEQEKKKTETESRFDNGSAETFVPVGSLQDIRSVYEMNSFEGKRKLKLLDKDLEVHGVIDDHKTSSVKEELAIAMNKMQFNK